MFEVAVDATESSLSESTDYFFRRIGEVRLSKSPLNGADGPRGRGWIRAVATAPLHGVLAFADGAGLISTSNCVLCALC